MNIKTLVILLWTSTLSAQDIYLYTSDHGPEHEVYLSNQLKIALQIPIDELRNKYQDEVSQRQIDLIEYKRRIWFSDVEIEWKTFDKSPPTAVTFPGYAFDYNGLGYRYLGERYLRSLSINESKENIVIVEDLPILNTFYLDLMQFIRYSIQLNRMCKSSTTATISSFMGQYVTSRRYEEVDELGRVWDIFSSKTQFNIHPNLDRLELIEYNYPTYKLYNERTCYVNTGYSVQKLKEEFTEVINPIAKNRHSDTIDDIIFCGYASGLSVIFGGINQDFTISTSGVPCQVPNNEQKLELLLLIDQGTGILDDIIYKEFDDLYGDNISVTPPIPERIVR